MALLAFIPARGGSKGIPRKNIHPLAGVPLIDYTLRATLASEVVDEIFVSTDDDEIIEHCRSLGVAVEYKRPESLAGDAAPMVDAVLDCLRWRQKQGMSHPDEFLLLQPTSPLRAARHIDEAVRQFRQEGAKTLVSVHPMVEHPYECVQGASGCWEFVARPADGEKVCRQDYETDFYYINGAIYLSKTAFVLEHRMLFEPSRASLYVVAQECGVDIDEPVDMYRAEAMLRFLNSDAVVQDSLQANILEGEA